MATSIHLSNSSLARQCMAASTCELLPRSTFTPGNPFQESNRSPPVRARSLVVTTRSFKFMKQVVSMPQLEADLPCLCLSLTLHLTFFFLV